MTTPRVATDVDSWCTRCKLMLAHTVEAMIGSRITRVHCNTCGAQHAYRPYPPGQQPVADQRSRPPSRASSERPAGRVAKRRADTAPTHDYETLIRRHDPSTARPYATTERFRAKELITHPSFGLGLVMADKGGKIEVLFRDGPRTLLHARPVA